jgi:hypothetical protein
MSHQLSLLDMFSATSSPASASGVTHSAAPGGPTIDPSGPPASLVSPLALRAVTVGFPTQDTSGQFSTHCASPSDLSLQLASRLRAKTASLGSTLYRLTWKHRATPSGRLICALRASVLRISASDCIGWPTPTATNRPRSPETLEKCAAFRLRNANQKTVPIYLGEAAMLAGWATPTVTDSRRGTRPPRPQDTGVPLTQQVGGVTAIRFIPTVSGETPNGSSAVTEAAPVGDQLNPALSLWLQGLPREWGSSGAVAMRSMLRSRPDSSKR